MLDNDESSESFLEYPPLPPCDCRESSCKDGNCKQTGYQYADISLPITLKPNVSLCDIEIECCGEPVVTCQKVPCNDMLHINVIQKVCVKIPLNYAVTACFDENNVSIDCDCRMP